MIVGWRLWQVRGGLLTALTHEQPWVPGQDQVAIHAGSDDAYHEAPQSGCSCGIYVKNRPLDDEIDEDDVAVHGLAGVGGTVIPHVGGWRGSRARILALVVHPAHRARDGRPAGFYAQLGARYGVPVFDTVEHAYGEVDVPRFEPVPVRQRCVMFLYAWGAESEVEPELLDRCGDDRLVVHDAERVGPWSWRPATLNEATAAGVTPLDEAWFRRREIWRGETTIVGRAWRRAHRPVV